MLHPEIDMGRLRKQSHENARDGPQHRRLSRRRKMPEKGSHIGIPHETRKGEENYN